MSAKLPTKEEELCHLENGLKNKKWLYIGCIQEMFYEDGIGDFNGIGEFIFITIFYDIIFGILYYFGAISFSILFIFIVIKIIIYSILIYASYYKYIKEIENTKMKIIKLKEEIEYQHTHPNSEFSLIGYWYAKGYSDEEIEKKIEDLINR